MRPGPTRPCGWPCARRCRDTGCGVRPTNRYGVAPARISHATVVVRDTGAAAVPGTMRELTFDGAGEVTLPPGADLRSCYRAMAAAVRLGSLAGSGC